MQQVERPVVAITMGDPAGIGPELALAALADAEVRAACLPRLYGDRGLLERVGAKLGLAPPGELLEDCAAIGAAAVRPGEVSAACGRAAYTYIERAVAAALAGGVAAIATGPINKEALRAAGVPYPGHTEILAALTASPRVCMMLASAELTVSMVTTHIGLCDVPERITTARVLEVIELTAAAAGRLKGRAGRLGVCGLNPHAGEHGLFGRQEEERAIEPAIAAARAKGLDVAGPIAPDTAFVAAQRARFDALVTMYHDQGHIPFKMLAFDTGVNITLGLPIVRVSVDHGTAFDIAWQGRASLTSLRQAILYAARMSRQI
jgi:4-hydroxythreonine-4-phosphate dehydrogenase